MGTIKNTILGTTRKGRALRASGLCVALAVALIGIVALAHPATGESQPISLKVQEAGGVDAPAASPASPENLMVESGEAESTPPQETNEEDPGEMVVNADAPAVASTDQSQAPRNNPSGAETASGTASSTSTPGHTHTWIDQTEIVHHDAVYTTVWHDPVYETKTTYHDVCVQCGAILDGGKAAEHLKSGTCTNYRTGVPYTEQVLISEGYSEQVLVTAAYDETIVVGRYCACGAKL